MQIEPEYFANILFEKEGDGKMRKNGLNNILRLMTALFYANSAKLCFSLTWRFAFILIIQIVVSSAFPKPDALPGIDREKISPIARPNRFIYKKVQEPGEDVRLERKEKRTPSRLDLGIMKRMFTPAKTHKYRTQG